MRSTLTGLGLSMALLAVPAQAAESEIGETSITIGYTSWSSSTSITALGKLLLEDIGYTVELKQLDTGLIYQALSTGAVDTFFSAWMPGQQSYRTPEPLQRLPQAPRSRWRPVNAFSDLQVFAT
jgi:ABC-type proline/glycine betaine transport system substrate-binding protein